MLAWFADVDAVLFVKDLCEPVKLSLRKRLPARNPVAERSKSCGFYTTGADTADLFGSYESTGLQYLEVLNDCCQRQVEGLGQLGHAGWALAQPLDDGTPCRFDEGPKTTINRWMVKHGLEYGDRLLNCQVVAKLSLIEVGSWWVRP